jgi:hypothetical protein
MPNETVTMAKFFYRYPLFILLDCIVILFMIGGCRKTTEPEKQAAENTAAGSPTFYTVSSATDPTVVAIAASLQRQDVNGDIESKLSDHAGVPKWDKAIVAEYEIANAGNSETGVTGVVKVVLIPFVPEGARQTNAMLKVKVTSADTSYHVIYAGQYRDFGFNKAREGSWNAINIFHLLTKFDKAIFGHNKFVVKDKRILVGLGMDVKEMAVVELLENKTVAGKLIGVPVCDFYNYCVKPCSGFEASPIRPLNCCLEWGTGTSCTMVWVEMGGIVSGGTALPLPGGTVTTIGGSTGSGGVSSIIDPCTISPYLGTPDHLCFVPDGGWEPLPINGLSPATGVGAFENFEVTNDDLAKINYWNVNNLDTSGLDNCRRALLNKLINTLGTNPLGVFLSKLDNALGIPNTIDKFKIHFLTRPLSNYDALTEHTTYDEISKVFEADIVLDSAISKDATDIFLVNTFLHEVIHAYMTFIWKKLNLGATQQEMNSLKYDQIFNAYVDTLRIRNSLDPRLIQLQSESIQHNYMADQLLEFMADIVKRYDNNPLTADRYY